MRRFIVFVLLFIFVCAGSFAVRDYNCFCGKAHHYDVEDNGIHQKFPKCHNCKERPLPRREAVAAAVGDLALQRLEV